MGIPLVKQVFVLVFLPFIAWADFFHSLPDGFSKNSADKIQLTILSDSQVKHLFKVYSQMSYLEYGYTLDGCSARAHEIAKMLDKQNISSAKIYLEGNLRSKLQQENPKLPYWYWHVANVVATRKNGKTEILVIDPALFSEPVSLDKFKQALVDTKKYPDTKISEEYFGSRFQYEPNQYEAQKRNWHSADFAKSRATLRINHQNSEFLKMLKGKSNEGTR